MLVRHDALAALPGIRHGWFTREGGVSEGVYDSLNTGLGSNDDRARVLENRARVAAAMDVSPDRMVTCYQVHSPDVIVVEQPWAHADNPQADALVTKRPGIAIAVSSADCGPVLFADAAAGVIGAAHAGWQGAFSGVLENTLQRMVDLGAERERIRAVVGPMISGEAYEVGPEFVERFRRARETVGRWFRPSGTKGHAWFDLPAYIVHRLRVAGVGEVQDIGLCTYSDET
ncbi:MAG TPA: peptidoglycan editing factor PgeF, partial [Methylomirabilota bacterium]|nr:peptidoglycan editing factor PgeF [Methylomirabilota bacterium]